MNNPIDAASLPLMKLRFVFAVHQRVTKGIFFFFFALFSKCPMKANSWHVVLLSFCCLARGEMSTALKHLSQLMLKGVQKLLPL